MAIASVARDQDGAPQGLESKHPGAQIVLIPSPSANVDDPLNWSSWRKCSQFATICFLSFMSVGACTCNLLAFVLQAKTYGVPSTDMTYTASAYLAGLIAGPILLLPVASMFGRPAVLFWCCVGQLACQIWSAEMTQSSDYIPFLLSRLFVGLFGAFPPAAAPGFIMDVFFLHQRGRLFTIWEITFLFGTLAPTTISGFIISNVRWKWCFWWTVPPLGLTAVLIFVFLEESNFNRSTLTCARASQQSWIRNRYETFFMGWKTVPRQTVSDTILQLIRPIAIGLAPISLIPGLFTLLAFGFAILVTLQTSIFLQTPTAFGGYGFSPLQNAYFSFATWVAAFAAWATGQLIGDRLPLSLASRRNQGVWQPEYRLCNVIVPTIVAPIGLGLYGAALQYHLHYMVLAVGYFLVAYAALLCVPVCINYVCECFVTRSLEVGIAFNVWRNVLGLTLNFFEQPWAQSVGVGWEFGMAALLVAFSGALACAMALKGHVIREGGVMKGMWQTTSENGRRIKIVATGD